VQSDETTWDAIVIGGGPAGSGVATYLAREGRRVLLLERERFPRPHVGESLLPGVLPYLDALGVREVIENAGFERKEGQTFVWGGSPWHIDFRELDVYPYAYFVDRARFDELLLKHAAKMGAEVREEHTVSRVLFEGGRAVGVSFRDPEGRTGLARGRFIVDASGQSALVARGAELRRVVRGLKNTALWAYFRGAARLPDERRQYILTASIPEGWVWVIPLGELTSVGVVTSRATAPDREKAGPEAWFEQAIRGCPAVWELLSSATRATPVRGARDWSYRARRMSGAGILLAGDAACFIDPILSTGVHLAMSAAHRAAAVVHSSLAEPRYEPYFRRYYEETLGTMYRELLAQVKELYRSECARDSMFWTSKRILRAGNLVRPDRAFLFITAGLLRNAATPSAHDPVAQMRAVLPEVEAALPKAKVPSVDEGPRVVWRVGPEGAAEIVTVRSEGMRLSLLRHEPKGLRDRPRDGFFAIELAETQNRSPLALAVVEERRRGNEKATGRVELSLIPYPIRAHDEVLLAQLKERLDALLLEADDGRSPLRLGSVRARLRRALLAPSALPAGVFAVKSRELRGGGVAEPPLSAVFEALSPDLPARRIYLELEARIPPELCEIPVLRTRFLDLFAKPGRLPDGRELGALREPARLIRRGAEALMSALQKAPSRAAAFSVAEKALSAIDVSEEGYRLLACGRLGEIA